MRLEAIIMNDLKEAMKAKDQGALRAIRAIKAAILLQKTDGSGIELDEDGEIKMLQKLVKQRQDSIDIFLKQNREDLAKTELEEVEVINKYLPEPVSESQLVDIIKGIIASTGASGMKDMGAVMAAANQQLAGRADGKAIAAVVKSSLG